MTVAAGDPISCFVVKVSMTVVKSVSDGLRDRESETQLNLNQTLRISAGPRQIRCPCPPDPAMMRGLWIYAMCGWMFSLGWAATEVPRRWDYV